MSIVLNGTSGIDSIGLNEDSSGNVGVGIAPSASNRLHVFAGGSAGATNAMRIQNSSSTDLLLVRDDGVITAVSPAGGLGYGTGAGGTVTQLTSKTTSVTLDKPTGQIVMNNASLAANTSVQFVFSNARLSATDTIIIHPNSNTAGYKYTVSCYYITTGQAHINVTNITAGPLSDALALNFAIIKGATA